MTIIEKKWLIDLAKAVITASATAGGAWLGANGAHAAGMDIPILNLKAFFVMLIVTAVREAFNFFSKRPLPEDLLAEDSQEIPK